MGNASLVLGSALGLAWASSAWAQAVPCSDPRGCPDIAVDRNTLSRSIALRDETFTADSCAVVEGMTEPGPRRLMRFTTTYPNLGPGDLVVGNPNDWPGLFEVAACHRHHHFSEYADYRLWTETGYAQWRAVRDAAPAEVLSADLMAAHPELAAELYVGEKRGFCIIDIRRARGVAGDKQPTYTSCASNQGISVGWADEYAARLDGQWIDVTGVPLGDYVLEVEVNAEHLFAEGNYANNSTAVSVRLR